MPMNTNIERLPWQSIIERLNHFKTDSLLIVIDKKISKQIDLNVLFPSAVVYECEAGEALKEISMFSHCVNFFLEKGVHRQSHLIAIGGGSVSDFAGFVASTLLRGISWSVVPTTLLAMVDAAIGGKTGVNTSFGKNLIGTFHLPENVFIDASFLKTLDKKYIDSGYGEILKYSFLSPLIKKDLSRDSEELIYQCALYKNDIVKNDFKENGDRKKLNLGHTFGHCVEKITGLEHGQSVVHGLQIIIDIYGDDKLKNDFQNRLEKLELSLVTFSKDQLNAKNVMSYLVKDKKIVSKDTIELIIPLCDGSVEIKKMKINKIKSDIEKYYE